MKRATVIGTLALGLFCLSGTAAASSGDVPGPPDRALQRRVDEAVKYCVSVAGSRAEAPALACNRKLRAVARQGERIVPMLEQRILADLAKVKGKGEDMDYMVQEEVGVTAGLLAKVKTNRAISVLVATVNRREVVESDTGMMEEIAYALNEATGHEITEATEGVEGRRKLAVAWKRWWEARQSAA